MTESKTVSTSASTDRPFSLSFQNGVGQRWFLKSNPRSEQHIGLIEHRQPNTAVEAKSEHLSTTDVAPSTKDL